MAEQSIPQVPDSPKTIHKEWKPTFRNTQEAFEQAIQEGRLSRDRSAANYAGNYMDTDTSTKPWTDRFKNINTRQYDV